jgi:hypothetical protein
MSRRPPLYIAPALIAIAACASAPSVPGEQARGRVTNGAIEAPLDPPVRPFPRARVASGLRNPRGMHVLPDGALLVSEAGTGAPDTGRLSRLRDTNADGDFDDEGERAVLLDAQPSKNIVAIVRRDEVFGMAGIAEGEGVVLVSLAFFGGPTTVFRVAEGALGVWASTHGNINDLAYDPKRHAWFGAASTSDEVVRLREGAGSERVAKIPPLAEGQDSVPGYLRHDPVSGALLVSLFSGSPHGEEGGEGVELVRRAGAIVRVDPDSREVTPEVVGLTAPTDIEFGPDGALYVLELCDRFVDPASSVEAMAGGASHGGFARYSGRLLRIDRVRRSVEVVARGLETPTNLALAGDALYVAQGMGTPGRPIPGPTGTLPLDGFIERIALR